MANTPRRPSSRGQAKDRSEVVARAAGAGGALVVLGLCLFGIVVAGKAIARNMRASAARERLSEAFSRLNDPNEFQGRYSESQTPGPFGTKIEVTQTYDTYSVGEATKVVAEEIEYLSDYCRRQIAAGDSPHAYLRLTSLASLIPALPADVDLEPLMRIPPGIAAYDAAVDLVSRRIDHSSLLAHSCCDDEDVRQFSGRALGRSMPFGRLDEADVAALAARTSIEEKTSAYDRLYAEAHRGIEGQLVGKYQLRLEGTWKAAEREPELFTLNTSQPVVEVDCANRDWTVKLLDPSWTGRVNDLPTLHLSVPVSRAPADVRQVRGLSPDATLELKCPDGQLSISLGPVALGTSTTIPPRDGYAQFSATLAK